MRQRAFLHLEARYHFALHPNAVRLPIAKIKRPSSSSRPISPVWNHRFRRDSSVVSAMPTYPSAITPGSRGRITISPSVIGRKEIVGHRRSQARNAAARYRPHDPIAVPRPIRRRWSRSRPPEPDAGRTSHQTRPLGTGAGVAQHPRHTVHPLLRTGRCRVEKLLHRSKAHEPGHAEFHHLRPEIRQAEPVAKHHPSAKHHHRQNVVESGANMRQRIRRVIHVVSGQPERSNHVFGRANGIAM